MNQQQREALNRLQKMFPRGGAGGAPQMPGGRGIFTGAGLLVGLGGLALAINASLFNGEPTLVSPEPF